MVVRGSVTELQSAGFLNRVPWFDSGRGHRASVFASCEHLFSTARTKGVQAWVTATGTKLGSRRVGARVGRLRTKRNRSKEAEPPSRRDRLGASMHVQLSEQTPQVVADRLGGEG